MKKDLKMPTNEEKKKIKDLMALALVDAKKLSKVGKLTGKTSEILKNYIFEPKVVDVETMIHTRLVKDLYAISKKNFENESITQNEYIENLKELIELCLKK